MLNRTKRLSWKVSLGRSPKVLCWACRRQSLALISRVNFSGEGGVKKYINLKTKTLFQPSVSTSLYRLSWKVRMGINSWVFFIRPVLVADLFPNSRRLDDSGLASKPLDEFRINAFQPARHSPSAQAPCQAGRLAVDSKPRPHGQFLGATCVSISLGQQRRAAAPIWRAHKMFPDGF